MNTLKLAILAEVCSITNDVSKIKIECEVVNVHSHQKRAKLNLRLRGGHEPAFCRFVASFFRQRSNSGVGNKLVDQDQETLDG